EATIKVSLILLAGFALAALFRDRAAALRHWMLAAAIAGAALAPALTAIAPAWHVGAFDRARAEAPRAPVERAITTSTPRAAIAPTGTVAVPARADGDRSFAGPTVARLWTAGAVVCMLPLLIGVARLTWIGSRARRIVDPAWVDVLAD